VDPQLSPSKYGALDTVYNPASPDHINKDEAFTFAAQRQPTKIGMELDGARNLCWGHGMRRGRTAGGGGHEAHKLQTLLQTAPSSDRPRPKVP
jgi:hypothetical protein